MTKWIGPDRFFWFTDRISVLPDNPAAPTHAVLAQLLYPMHRRAGAHSRARGRSRTVGVRSEVGLDDLEVSSNLDIL